MLRPVWKWPENGQYNNVFLKTKGQPPLDYYMHVLVMPTQQGHHKARKEAEKCSQYDQAMKTPSQLRKDKVFGVINIRKEMTWRK